MNKFKLIQSIVGMEKRIFEIEAENKDEALKKFKQTSDGWIKVEGVKHISSKDHGETEDIEVTKIE